MISNLQSIYRASEEQARIAFIGLGALVVFGMLGIVFLSPLLVVGLIGAALVIFTTFVRPTWMLTGLLWYLPFEPFLLKWVPDELYAYAKYGSELVIYLLCASVIWRIVTGGLHWKRTPLDGAALLTLVALVATTLINLVAPVQAILGIRQIIRFVLLFFVATYLAPSWKWIRGVLIGIAVIIALQVALGVGQAVIGESLDSFLLPSARRTLGEIQLSAGTVQFWDPGARVFGTLGRYDQLGTFLAFFLLLAVAFLYEKVVKEKYQRYLALGILATLPVLAMSYSRSAWFGFLLGFLFIALFMKRDRWVLAVSIVTPIVLAIYLAFSGLVVHQIVDSADQTFAERLFEVFSVARFQGEYDGLGRTYWIVQTIITVVPSAPLFGYGPASFGGGAVAALGNGEVYDQLGLPFGVYGTEGYIDNNWFSLWGELGTFGLVAYLMMFGTLFAAALRVYRHSKNAETRALALGFCAAMIAVTLNAFLATFLEVRTLAVYLWVFGGLVVALGQRERIL